MRGFESSPTGETTPAPAATGLSPGRSPTAADVHVRIRRAHHLRSLYLAVWPEKTAQSWASVFRRPGRLAPKATSRLQTMTPGH